MRKFALTVLAFVFIALLCLLFSCTDNQKARQFGGSETIKLPPGQKLVTATWKQDNLWVLTEPMPADYVPVIKTFQENSNYGLWQGRVTFVESK